jgi:hypothetical protein
MNPFEDRWASLQAERLNGQGAALPDPLAVGPACGGLRVRREGGARDTINSRAWDFFHATPPTQVDSAGLEATARTQGRAVYMDMNPINSRTSDVKFRIQPEYMPDPPRPPARSGDLGIPGAAATGTLPSDKFSQNYYTQRLDAGGEYARNMIRELRSAVTEDNRERGVEADRALAQRQFYDRWLPARAATDAASLQAYDLLRPKQDDWRSAYAGDDYPGPPPSTGR